MASDKSGPVYQYSLEDNLELEAVTFFDLLKTFNL